MPSVGCNRRALAINGFKLCPLRATHEGAVIVAPATYNTINKWAAGASDNHALGVLAETFGLGIPVVVLPFVNSALAAHFAFTRRVADLAAAPC